MALTKENWIDAGWLLMANQGFEALKIEVLARQLKVSKGSFYWHFKNRQELLEAILQRWEQETNWLIEESQTEATAEKRLFKLFALIEQICQQSDPEFAIFTWASQDLNIQKRVSIVETKRVNYLTELLQEYGFSAAEARQKAEVAYFAFMGFADRLKRDREFTLSVREFNNFLLSLLLSPINYQ